MDLKAYHKQLQPLEREVFDNGYLVTLGREVSNIRADPRRNHQGCAGFILYEFPLHNRYRGIYLPNYNYDIHDKLQITRNYHEIFPEIPDNHRTQPQEETDAIFDGFDFLKDSEYYLDSE